MFKAAQKVVLSLVLALMIFQVQANTNPTNLILMGPPASGKGTQGEFITKKLGIPVISTGQLLRAEVESGSELGQTLSDRMSQGLLIEDKVVLELLKKRLSQEDAKQGFLLDGFPRTVEQAKALTALGVEIDQVLVLEVPDKMIVKRISGRRIHQPSGRTYHVDTNPPKNEGKDDVTGEPLITRADDTPEVIKKRLEVYHSQTKPVIEYYKALSESGESVDVVIFDGNQSVGQIAEAIEAALER